jgi:uncharacterized protein
MTTEIIPAEITAGTPAPTASLQERKYTRPMAPAPQPVAEKERIVSIDVLRGFALLGILPMNIQYFSMISAAYMNPTAYGDLTGANYWVWLLSHVLADEKFMTIFSMLFGAGILLMTSRIEATGRRTTGLHYRRMGWLVGFGLAHAYLLWSGDILFTYGICGMVAYLARKLRPRTLLILGLLIIAVASGSLAAYSMGSRHWSAHDLQIATEDLWKPTPAQTANEIMAYRGTWIDQMKYRIPSSLQMETAFFIGFTFWRVTGLMLVGMALFKLGFFSARRPAREYWTMIAIAATIGIPIILYGTRLDFAHGWDFRYSFFSGAQFNYWASILVSLGWVGAMMLASRVAVLLVLTRRLAAVGRMAFTNYIMHTAICTTIFYGRGFGLFGKVERIAQFAIVLAIWALQLVISPIWLKYFLFGPLEWLWRSLTYWQWEPLRRSAAQMATGERMLA